MKNRTEWTTMLHDFTRRNAGRMATLEIDDPEYGAQIQDASHPLLGVAYDTRDERVEIMLGEQGSTENRITHTIPGATSVECAADGSGETLRVTSGRAHTLLRVR
jgi:hypothetical protein